VPGRKKEKINKMQIPLDAWLGLSLPTPLPFTFFAACRALSFFVYASLIFAESQRSNSNDQRVAGARVAGS